MRPLPSLVMMFAAGLFTLWPQLSFAQTKTYQVKGRPVVRLQVSPEYLMVRKPPRDIASSESIGATAERAIIAQAREIREEPAKYTALSDKAVGLNFRGAPGVLVPRLPTLESHQIAPLSAAVPGTSLAYTLNGKLVVPIGTVSVRFPSEPPQDTLAGLRATYKLESLDNRLPLAHVYRFRCAAPPDDELSDSFQVALLIQNNLAERVLWAQPDLVVQASPAGDSPAPSDAYFAHQYYLSAIQMPEAWKYSRGSREVIVAVLDDGIDGQHPDLKENLLPSRDYYERPNAVNGGEHPDTDLTHTTGKAHGTHVAGIIGAMTDNTIGIAGASWSCGILPVRIVGGELDLAYEVGIINALYFAKDKGAKVITISLDLSALAGQRLLADAIQEISKDGKCMIVAAAGNSAGDIVFPANDPNCLAVGALKRDDTRHAYSCTSPVGAKHLKLMAPSGLPNYAGDVWTLDVSGQGGQNRGPGSIFGPADGDFINAFGGTSAAAPIVSAVAAITWAKFPDLTAADVQKAMILGAEKVSATRAAYDASGYSQSYGYGKINALRTLQEAAKIAGKPLVALAQSSSPQAVPRALAAKSGGREDNNESQTVATFEGARSPATRQGETTAVGDSMDSPQQKLLKFVLSKNAMEPQEWTIQGRREVAHPMTNYVVAVYDNKSDSPKNISNSVESAVSLPPIDGKFCYLVHRDDLKDRENLESAAREENFPLLFPAYQSDGRKVFPTGKIRVGLYSVNDRDVKQLDEIAQKFGWKVSQANQRSGVELEIGGRVLTGNPFEVVRELGKAEGVKWIYLESPPASVGKL